MKASGQQPYISFTCKLIHPPGNETEKQRGTELRPAEMSEDQGYRPNNQYSSDRAYNCACPILLDTWTGKLTDCTAYQECNIPQDKRRYYGGAEQSQVRSAWLHDIRDTQALMPIS